MFKSKKLIKIISLLATFAFVLFLMLPTKIEAAWLDDSHDKVLMGKNQFVVNPTAEGNSLVITLQYRYGVKDIEVVLCRSDDSAPTDCENAGNRLSYFAHYKNPNAPAQGFNSYINTTTQDFVIKEFSKSSPTSGIPIQEFANGTYNILVRANFCQVRSPDHKSCSSWQYDVETAEAAKNGVDVEHQPAYFSAIQIDGAFTGNSDVNNIIARVLTIVNDYVIPVLWVALFILLVVRGVILAIGIVKASDEAEVRAAKIKGMVWLAIGVFAAYIMTFGASWLMSLFGYGGILS
jgi:hypothetical protein